MAVVGVMINLFMSLLCIAMGADSHAYELSYEEATVYGGFGYVGLFSCALAILGLVLTKVQASPKLGSILVIVGSILFVPIGLIAVFGAKSIKDSYEREKGDVDLEARRRAYQAKEKGTEFGNNDFEA